MATYTHLFCVPRAAFMVMLMSIVGNAQSSYRPGVGFAPIEIATSQTVRVSALNRGTGSSATDTSCSVTLQFLDANGQVLKQRVSTLQRGKAASLDLSSDELRRNGSHVSVRAVLLFGYFGGAPPSAEIMQLFDCNIAPSLEIFDSDPRKKSVVLTDAKPLPPPATPAQ